MNDQKILSSYNLVKRQVNETEIIEILDIINKNIDNEIKLKNELGLYQNRYSHFLYFIFIIRIQL